MRHDISNAASAQSHLCSPMQFQQIIRLCKPTLNVVSVHQLGVSPPSSSRGATKSAMPVCYKTVFTWLGACRQPPHCSLPAPHFSQPHKPLISVKQSQPALHPSISLGSLKTSILPWGAKPFIPWGGTSKWTCIRAHTVTSVHRLIF